MQSVRVLASGLSGNSTARLPKLAVKKDDAETETLMRVLASASLLIFFALVVPGMAQDRVEDTIRVRTREVALDVLVEDKRTGVPVTDLTRENFEVLDDGKPRKLSYFSRAGEARTRPLALVLLLDLWPSGAGRFLRQPGFTESLVAALAKLPPEDEVAVLATSVDGVRSKSQWLSELTRDRAKTAAALALAPKLIGEKQTIEKEYVDYFAAIVRDVARLATERAQSQTVLVVVSDGLNSLDTVFFKEREKTVAQLLSANMIFSALTYDLSGKKKALVAASKPLFVLARASVVGSEERFAKATGGEALSVNTPEEYAKGLEEIVGSLAARYSLAFTLGESELDDGRLHKLAVRVTARDPSGKKRQLEVRARRGYYVPKPAETERTKDEQAIRQSLYELEYAYATGEVETVKRLTSKRTLDLYRLGFGMLAGKTGVPADEDSAASSQNDDLFTLMLRAVAGIVGQTKSPEEIRRQAQTTAKSSITFIDDRTARIADEPSRPTALAVFEDGVWKIDDTEMVKQEFLTSPNLSLEEKKRIKEF
jgi:VWFA-related protein